MSWLPKKTVLTILTFAGMLAATHLFPVLHDYMVVDWRSISAVLDFVDRQPSRIPEADEQLRLRPETDPEKLAKLPLLDPNLSLDHFYHALHLAEGHGPDAVARILHYGDSPTTADLITSDVRSLLQKQFGDAGHGFCLVAKPWAWYGHKGLEVEGSGWTIDPATQGALKDGCYGLGGVSFRGTAGSIAQIRVKDRRHRRLEVAFLLQPGGGQLRVEADNVDLGAVDTDARQRSSGFARFTLPENCGLITLRAMNATVRLFGVMLEKDTSGAIYHSLGVNGASISILARNFNEQHWTEQLHHYRPDLVIINYGTNESMYPSFVDYASEKEMREVVRRVRKALPEVSILVMSPMDRGQRMSGGEIGTVPAIPRLVAIQERVARDTGSAFFNTFTAMGGNGTMGRWYEAEPRLVGADFIHPMPAGARIVGGLLYQSLLDGYNKYKLRLIQKNMMAGNR